MVQTTNQYYYGIVDKTIPGFTNQVLTFWGPTFHKIAGLTSETEVHQGYDGLLFATKWHPQTL